MAREEADFLPLLQARLCTRQQRDMVWRTLHAMPLRLLERVLPWLAGQPSTLYTCGDILLRLCISDMTPVSAKRSVPPLSSCTDYQSTAKHPSYNMYGAAMATVIICVG